MFGHEYRDQRLKSIGEVVSELVGSGDELKDSRGGASYIIDRCIIVAKRRAQAMQIGPEDTERAITKSATDITLAFNQCESPIERRLLPALVFAYYGEQFSSFPAEVHCPKLDQAAPTGDIVVIPQFAFIRYRLDFAIIGEFGGFRKIVCVECDGAEFHVRQSADRQRDSYLKAFGIDVFRFSGKDIQADPLPLATRAADALIEWRASLK